MRKKYRFRILCKPGKDKKSNCFCNADSPGCTKGYDKENGCVLIKHTYNPFSNIEECFENETHTYKRVHGRIQRKGGK